MLTLVEGLEVVPDLVVVVAWHLLPRDRVFHQLPVLPDDAEVLQARGHLPTAARQVGVVAVLPSAARLTLDAHVEGVSAEPRGRLTLGRAALAAAWEEPLALAEVLVLGTRPVAAAPALAPARPALVAPAAKVLARALRLVLRAHLVERALHGLEGAIGLAALERLHALGRVARPVAALAAEPLHLLEELAQLLRRDVGVEPAAQRLRLAVDHLVLRVREVRLEIRQTVHLLEELQAIVALLQEAVEVRPRAREGRGLEDRREIARRGARGARRALGEVPLLEARALERVLGERPGALFEHRGLRPLFVRLLLARRQEVRKPSGRQRDRGREREREHGERRQRQPADLAREHAPDDPARWEPLDARDGVGDEDVHERRPVGPLGPLQRRRDPVVEGERAVRETRGVDRPDPSERAVQRPGERTRRDERRAAADGHGAEGGLEDQQEGGDERAPEGPAERVVL